MSIERDSSWRMIASMVRVLDDHELALCDFPALDDLVVRDLAVVDRAPPLLLDRRPALLVQGPKLTSEDLAAGFVARARPIGILTRPKLIEPFQIVRIASTSLGDHEFSPSRRDSLRVGLDAMATEAPAGRARTTSGPGLRTIPALWQKAASAGRTNPCYLVEHGDHRHEVSWAEAATAVEELANGPSRSA